SGSRRSPALARAGGNRRCCRSSQCVAGDVGGGLCRRQSPAIPRRGSERRSALEMWLIRIALRRPISVMVIVVAIALCSVLAIMRTRIDIFPDLNLPVIYVAQPYGGMSPQQMEGFISYYYEY